MIECMLSQFDIWQSDNTIACIFIYGSGEKAFCAGGDIHALRASALSTPGGPCVEAENFFAREYRLNHLLHCYKKPVIAWGHGIVMGGGLGIFAGASHRIATETSRFAMPEVTIGLFPDVGGSYFLNKMPDKSGRFLALTGALFNASDALFTDIANIFISGEKFNSVIQALVDHAPSDNTAVQSVLTNFEEPSVGLLPNANIEPHMDIINRLCESENILDVILAFKELNTEEKWLSKAKRGLLHGSPNSIKIIDEQLKRSANLPLNEIFRSELILSTHCVRFPDFAEGVRALLVDKDHSPQWQYSDITEIPEELTTSFFTPPWLEHPLADL